MSVDAVVLGLDSTNSLALIRGLKSAGLSAFGFQIGREKPIAAYSRLLSGWAPVDSEEALVQALLKLEVKNKPVVFAANDRLALFIEQHAPALSSRYYLPLSNSLSLRDLVDKLEILEFGRKAGFEILWSCRLSDLISGASPPASAYPLIAKPANSISGSRHALKLLNNREEVERFASTVKDQFVLQAHLDRPITDHFEIHTYLSSTGPLIAGMLQKITPAYFDGIAPRGARVKSVWIEELAGPALRLTQNLNFSGALDINLLRDQAGRFCLLEVNFRTSGNHAIDNAAGLNLPAIITLDQFGRDFSAFVVSRKLDQIWVDENLLLNELHNKQIDESTCDEWINQAHARAYGHPGDDAPYQALHKKFTSAKNTCCR